MKLALLALYGCCVAQGTGGVQLWPVRTLLPAETPLREADAEKTQPRAANAVKKARVAGIAALEPFIVAPAASSTQQPIRGHDRYGLPFVEHSTAQRLIAAGKAIYWPVHSSTSPSYLACLVEAQSEAIKQKKGVWQKLRLFSASKANAIIPEQLVVVQGTVHRVAVFSSDIYINFAEDYTTDFTLHIKSPKAKSWRKDKQKRLEDIYKPMEGAFLRVHGTVIAQNGPLLPVSLPFVLTTVGKDGSWRVFTGEDWRTCAQ